MLANLGCRGIRPSLSLRRPAARAAGPRLVKRHQSTSTPRPTPPDPSKSGRRSLVLPAAAALLVSGAVYVAYEHNKPFRHAALAVVRCSRIAAAAILGAIDYKWTFAKSYETHEASERATSECHKRSAERVLRALLANGGVFIKLGQHMAALVVLPQEWRDTMRPLQDRCDPSSLEDIEQMFLEDEGKSLSDMFEEFDPEPIGVASLAQVHVGKLKSTSQQVAVKLQHPHIQEFCDIDMDMVEFSLGWIKHWFPEFELTWLGGEMRENLPKEIDFAHEARNARLAGEGFKNLRTSLYIPKVLEAKKRILIMEFIRGGRPDDLQYLADHNIDRNAVSLELARIFAQMVHLNGFFHADPHPGNLLIRPAGPSSRSPYNFEVVLLDHGLYFDLDDELRINYSKFWLALIASPSTKIGRERRKYAKLVGNIDEDLYPVFEAAITGRALLDESPDELPRAEGGNEFKRGRSMIDLDKQTSAEIDAIQKAVIQREGLILDILSVLRRIPRRVLMVLKLNDLTRSLDHALITTHSGIRVFLVTAKYCTRAVWEDERRRLFESFSTRNLLSFLVGYVRGLWLVLPRFSASLLASNCIVTRRFETTYRPIVLTEAWMDFQAELVILRAWVRGLVLVGGFAGAHQAAAGLA
ncbi:ABC1-domain-containing protein [Irpex rosettiformis]|uniref:ABC1-domain-containing protein n=1 Tax=Irpex rosettiformis TaxID=378272 RepID=A0ACB8UG21_9APHY|nr:ABC1-domain-containing protein [Irpex rosettiformis]